MIRVGAFPENGTVELDLSKQLGVSRTPLREALFQLCREGVLEDTGRGYRVPILTLEAVREIVEMRLMIEPQAAAMTVARADAEAARGLAEAVAAEEAAFRAGDTNAFVLHNSTFRTRLLAACGNARVAQVLAILDDQIQRLRSATLTVAKNQETTIAFHRAFLTALSAGDESAAAEAMRKLLVEIKNYYEAQWQSDS